MAIEAGAQLWHMGNFESSGMLHGLALKVNKGSRAALDVMGVSKLHTGLIFVVGDDVSRYFNESESNRHGHIYNHGSWTRPQNQIHPYLIFDQKQYTELQDKSERFLENAVSAETTASLAVKIHVDPKILGQEIKDFNFLLRKKGIISTTEILKL